MPKPLARLLRREQLAFLARDRSAWTRHLERTRTFLGEGLQTADPNRPVLVLGAGSGLEVPWALAPPRTTGWDADPWSRLWTFIRHQRWVPWVFADATGAFEALEATARRAVQEPWSGRRRGPEAAALRLAGLLPSLHPNPVVLKAWIEQKRPGTVLAANLMGQFGVVAQRLVEGRFGGPPWEMDPERTDPLAEALEAWTRRVVESFLEVLRESNADLWLVHDRAVVFGEGPLELDSWEPDWTKQLRSDGPIEASDPLGGVDVTTCLGEEGVRRERWLWPVAPGQRHLVEALAFRGQKVQP